MFERFTEKAIKVIIIINDKYCILEVLRKSFNIVGVGISINRCALEIYREKRLVRLTVDILSLMSSFATGALEFWGLNRYSKYTALASTILISIRNMSGESICNLPKANDMPEIDEIAHEIAQEQSNDI